jgi:co-chaperonin GroES (HSP10)
MSNASGWIPVEFNCVVSIDKVEEKTKGGVYLPDHNKDREQSASVMGTMLEASPLAFSYEVWPEGTSKPKAGERVLIAKYAGLIFTGKDGEEYRMCKDKDILAIGAAQ